jgi:hypothetical protein
MAPRKTTAATPPTPAAPRKPRKSSTLRVVAPGEPAPKPAAKKKPLTLEQAVELGDYREILRAQRRSIVDDIGNEKGPALAALHRQLSLISKEIEALDARAAQDAEGSSVATPDDEWEAV